MNFDIGNVVIVAIADDIVVIAIVAVAYATALSALAMDSSSIRC